MAAEDITIPVSRYDFIWATHDRGTGGRALEKIPSLVIMIHGFPGDSKSYGNVFQDLSDLSVKDGFHTLRFDMRGCGQSNKGSHFFTLRSGHEDCMTVIRWAQKLGYENFYLIGEGLGALIAITTLTETIRSMITGMVFLWPILLPRDAWYGGLQWMVDEAETRGDDFITVGEVKIGLSFMDELREYNLLPLMNRVTMPTFIQHGDADTRAITDHVTPLMQNAGTERLEVSTFTGGEHGLKKPKEREQLLDETRAFLKKIASSA